MHVYFIPYFNVLLGYTLGILCAIFKAYFVILFRPTVLCDILWSELEAYRYFVLYFRPTL